MMNALAKLKMEEEERQWEEEKRTHNRGEYKVTQEFDIIGEHEAIKQIIQEFFEDIESKTQFFEVLYEYYKATAKTTGKYKVKLVFCIETEYNLLKQLVEQLQLNLKSNAKQFKVIYEYYKKIR